MGGYQIKVSIKDSRPPMWRRIFIPDCISFSGLHEIIQAAFQKSGRCLSRFAIPAHRQRISDNSLPIDPYMKEKQFIDYTYILKGKIDFLSGARMEDLNLSLNTS